MTETKEFQERFLHATTYYWNNALIQSLHTGTLSQDGLCDCVDNMFLHGYFPESQTSTNAARVPDHQPKTTGATC